MSSVNPSSSPQLKAQRNLRGYFEHVVFQVEDQLFSVPRWYFVQNSTVFRDMFLVPTAAAQPVEGSSDDCPLVLEGVKVEDFQALISLMYPQITYSTSGTREYPQEQGTPEEKIKYYIPILELSRKWYFRGLHAYAVKQLTDCWDSVDKILVGKRYDIPQWIVGGFKEIVDRETIMTPEEGERLGWEMTLGIFALREHRLQLSLRRFGWSLECKGIELSSIQSVFGDDISSAESTYTNFYADGDSDS